jgi:hypothetical protein
VPTDPFVSPDLDDRPRQQQNLPPGVAYPPARSWRGGRPGELGPDQPHGRLFGSPGPNVGYAYTLAERVRPSLKIGPHERLADVVAVVAEVAGRRASSLGRAPVTRDVELAAALLGYDANGDAEWVERRTLLVHDAAHDYPRRRALIDSVPDELLRSAPAVAAKRAGEWRDAVAASLLHES